LVSWARTGGVSRLAPAIARRADHRAGLSRTASKRRQAFVPRRAVAERAGQAGWCGRPALDRGAQAAIAADVAGEHAAWPET
jgi:hypothetical protein